MPAKLLTLALLFVMPLLALAEQPESLEFREETYNLAAVNVDKNGKHKQILNEYVPEEEDLEEWSSMIAVRQYFGRTDFKELGDALVKVLKQQNPDFPSATHISEDGKRKMVDFIMWDVEKEIVEFNVFIYELSKDGKSVIAYQYAQREYGEEEGLEFLKDLKKLRPKLLESVSKFKFPKITEQQPEEAAAE
ncbi:hypothetical protein NA78x_001506 [Anatilimnocola sp. NA78]|uniref:hypothetical protein n=1 Tax=Anatilimnocola sp. NA78 TaxID=3415683 RepID=UPI003CE4E057